jgi:hypothetical protein
MDTVKPKKERSELQIKAFDKIVEARKQKIQQRKTQKEKDKELKKLNRKKKSDRQNGK